MRNLRITSKPHASQEEITFVREAIARHNVAVTRDTYYSPLAIFLRDERDAIMGGTFGDLWGGWLELTLLWVAEPLRGQGYGARLLLATEEEAKTQGCRGVFLSTFSFQARPFYERFGYEVFGELPEYPEGHSLYFMKKMLRDPEPN
ncbi:MAG: GNAT family N-acetyltransferase [Rubrobacteraceae bacterium]